MRWIVGDIHGSLSALDRLLAAIRFDPSRDEMWSVGDLVNTGGESAATLRLWKSIGGRAVLGNHDLYALRVHAGRKERKGYDTLDDLYQAPDVDELMDYLRGFDLLVHLPGSAGARDVWLVHAGLHPAWKDLSATARRLNSAPRIEPWMRSGNVRFATRARCCTSDGVMLDNPGPPGACSPPYHPWDTFYKGEALAVHGHWAQRGYYRGERTMSLDSGCVYGGPLTAWCQQEDRIVQV